MWLLEEVIAKGYSDEVVTFFLMAAEEAAIFNTAGVSFLHFEPLVVLHMTFSRPSYKPCSISLLILR